MQPQVFTVVCLSDVRALDGHGILNVGDALDRRVEAPCHNPLRLAVVVEANKEFVVHQRTIHTYHTQRQFQGQSQKIEK